MNHTKSINPQKQKLIIKNTAVFFTSDLRFTYPKVISTIASETADFIIQLTANGISGSNIINEHKAPKILPDTSLAFFGLSLRNFAVETSMK